MHVLSTSRFKAKPRVSPGLKADSGSEGSDGKLLRVYLPGSQPKESVYLPGSKPIVAVRGAMENSYESICLALNQRRAAFSVSVPVCVAYHRGSKPTGERLT